MSDIKKFNNTKWDVSEWTDEMKIQWQKKMISLGFNWKGRGRKVIHLEAVAYFIDTDITCQIYEESVYFALSNLKELTWEDAFPEKKTKPSIFDNPKWVTAITTDLEVGLVEGKDYKVYKVEEEKFWVYNDMQSPTPVWYYKDRFHKVTYEDLLPEKATSEGNGGSFEDLVIDHTSFYEGTYIVTSKFSREQLSFMQEVLPTYSDKTFNHCYVVFRGNTFLYTTAPFWRGEELSFNNIFKHKSEI